MTSGVYVIEHVGSGKQYVGSASNIPARWRMHRHMLRNNKHHSTYMQRAWNKYGEDAFLFAVVEKTNLLLAREQHWIDTLNPVYNTCRVAGSTTGCIPTAAHIAKIVAANTGKKRSPEMCARIGAVHKGKPKSDEHRRKLSASKLGKRLSPEVVARIAHANTGKKRSAETKKLMSEKSKGHKRHTPEQKAMLVKLHTGNTYCVGRVLSEETKAKIAEGQRRHQATLRAAKGKG